MAIGPVNVAATSVNVDAVVAAHQTLRLKGFAVGETAAVATNAEVLLIHGATVAGGVAVTPPINLDPNGFGLYWFPDGGIPCPNGISVNIVAGTATFVLYVDRL